MKRALLILTSAILTNIATISAQNVNIPDANFKAALVANTSINTNGDAEIQVSEAIAYTGTIDISFMGISSLTGIEAFTVLNALNCSGNQLTNLNVSANTALNTLFCWNNQLTSLNVSANTALTNLGCTSNQLTSLNVSSNTALTYLDCGANQLTSLNVSSSTALTYLFSSINQLTSLNVSSNTALAEIYCSDNQLTSLNVASNIALIQMYCDNNQLTSLNMKNGNNSNLQNFNAINNTSLTCIKVDDAVFMNTNWANAIDSWGSYSVSCNVGIPNYSFSNAVLVYPNPTTGVINLSDFYNVTLTGITGKVILEKQNTNMLDISNHPAGMYFILLTGSRGLLVQRSKMTKI